MRVPLLQTKNSFYNGFASVAYGQSCIKLHKFARAYFLKRITNYADWCVFLYYALTKNMERKSRDRPTRTPNVVFVVASHYLSLQL